MNDQKSTSQKDDEFPPVSLEETRARVTSGITRAIVGFAAASLPGVNIIMIFIVMAIVATSFIINHLSQQKSRPMPQRARYRNIHTRVAIASTAGGASSLAVTLITMFTS